MSSRVSDMTTQPDIELLTDELVEAAAAFKTHGLERTRAALRGGAALARLKEMLPHGSFTTHIETHGYTARTSQRWMRLHEAGLSAEEIQELGGIGKAIKSLSQAAEVGDSPGPVVLEGDDQIDREWLESLGVYYGIDGEELGCYAISNELSERIVPGDVAIDFFQGRLRLITLSFTKEESDALMEACRAGNVIEIMAGDDGNDHCVAVAAADANSWNRPVGTMDTYRTYMLFDTWRVNGQFRKGEQCLLYYHRHDPAGKR